MVKTIVLEINDDAPQQEDYGTPSTDAPPSPCRPILHVNLSSAMRMSLSSYTSLTSELRMDTQPKLHIREERTSP